MENNKCRNREIKTLHGYSIFDDRQCNNEPEYNCKTFNNYFMSIADSINTDCNKHVNMANQINYVQQFNKILGKKVIIRILLMK
jgi:hypothetical protein